MRDSPCHKLPVSRWSFNAIKIGAELLSVFDSGLGNSRERYAHRAVPDALRRVDPCGSLEPGCPLAVSFEIGRGTVDRKIEPLALRREFEFLISLGVLPIVADEQLHHIPIPQLPSLTVSLWCRS